MIIAGTGHRPDKLGGYGVEAGYRLVITAEQALMSVCNPDSDTVISGGALGWDQALAEAALSLGIKLVFAIPLPGFENRWPPKSQAYLHGLMHRAAEVKYICEEPYAGWKMQKRNEWMVDNADKVLACWDGSTGGTGNCIAYANKVGKEIINVYPQWLSNSHITL